MAFNPAVDVAAYLRAQLTGEPVITVQGLPSNPDDAIAVLSGPGTETLAMGLTVVSQEASIQVITRGARGEGQATEVLAQAIHTLLQSVADVSMNAVPYALVEAASEPAYVGTDSSSRPLWSGNYHVIRDPE